MYSMAKGVEYTSIAVVDYGSLWNHNKIEIY